jgi:hypothetical protein
MRKKRATNLEGPDCFDLEIIPPMVLVNRLPFPLMYRIKRVGEDRFEKLDQQETCTLQDIVYSQTSNSQIQLKLALEDSSAASQLDLYTHGTEE